MPAPCLCALVRGGGSQGGAAAPHPDGGACGAEGTISAAVKPGMRRMHRVVNVLILCVSACRRVLVNGVPLGESFDALKLFICVAYTGDPKPRHCYDPPAAAANAAGGLLLPGRRGVTRPTATA